MYDNELNDHIIFVQDENYDYSKVIDKLAKDGITSEADQRWLDYMISKGIVPAKKETLPYDAKIEYLEATASTAGMFYIDTDFKPSTLTKITLHANVTRTVKQSKFFFSNTNLIIDFYINSSACYAYNFNRYRDNATNYTLVKTGDTTVILDGKNKYLKVTLGGTIKWEVNNITMSKTYRQSGTNLYLIGHPNNVGLQCRFYSCTIEEDDVLVRDFIPVRKGSVGYLYDRVSKQLFDNAGTGDFIVGPDK